MAQDAGRIDQSFQVGSGPDAAVRAVTLQPDGKILIAGGFRSISGAERAGLARLHSDGTVDADFSAAVDFGIAAGGVNALSVQSGGIVIGGLFSIVNGVTRNNLARLTADGLLDSSFDPGQGPSGAVHCITADGYGRLLVGGAFSRFDGEPRTYLVRLNSDGSIDNTFTPGLESIGAIEGGVQAVVVQPNEKIVVGGLFKVTGDQNLWGLVRLNSDGTLDTAFGQELPSFSYLNAIGLQGSNLVIGGSRHGGTSAWITRLNDDRSVDSTFQLPQGIRGIVYSLLIQENGKILAGGSFDFEDGRSRNLVRLHADGQIDLGFDVESTGSVLGLTLQNDKVLVAGAFSEINGVETPYLARLWLDGGTNSVSVTSNSSGGLRINLPAISGESYRLEASEDLQTWRSIKIVQATSSQVVYYDGDAHLVEKRFFRLVPVDAVAAR